MYKLTIHFTVLKIKHEYYFENYQELLKFLKESLVSDNKKHSSYKECWYYTIRVVKERR